MRNLSLFRLREPPGPSDSDSDSDSGSDSASVYRGLKTDVPVEENEVLIFVPVEVLITSTIARNSTRIVRTDKW